MSGGGDSMALLALLHATGADICAATVDHGLRPEAAGEAAVVARFCAARGIAHEVLQWTGWDGQGNLQAEARAARYRLLADWAGRAGLGAVALAHTMDDQAETFLMRLARQAGSDGLSGMAARIERDGAVFLRPLLEAGRDELRDYLIAEGIDWAEDPSNSDARFDRVKARAALEALAPLGLDAPALAGVARNLSQENKALRTAFAKAAGGIVTQSAGALSILQGRFGALDPEFRRRLLIAAIGFVAPADYAPRRAGIAEALAALEAGDGFTLGGAIGWRGQGKIWIAREMAAVPAPVSQGRRWGRWVIEGEVPDGAQLGALGPEGLSQIPDWRALGLPRRVLLPTPALWRGDRLIAAPLAGFGPSLAVSCGEFTLSPVSH